MLTVMPPPLPPPPPPPPPPPQQQQMAAAAAAAAGKRKKWTEEEERTLIDKYGEMLRDGTLARMKTREKKFRPIAGHVNAAHHALDPVAFPFHWSWKDASTKVQNMRHQYLLVKQKLASSSSSTTTTAGTSATPTPPSGGGGGDQHLDFPWEDGVSYWPNFLRYKHVFGDHPLPGAGGASAVATATSAGAHPEGCFGNSITMEDDDGDLVLGLGFECGPENGDEEGFDYEEVVPSLPQSMPPPLPVHPLGVLPPAVVVSSRKKRKKRTERRAWAFIETQLARLKEREALLEEQEAERESERQGRDRAWAELVDERERERRDWALKVEEWEEMWRQRQEEGREWEERVDRRRLEWRKRMEGMLNQHRVEMEQMQARIIQDQQSILNQMLGIVAQWVGPSPHPGGLSDSTVIVNHHHNAYLSQMMQNSHHVNGMVHMENRDGGDSQDDQFIVDDG